MQPRSERERLLPSAAMITIHGPDTAPETRAAERLRRLLIEWYPGAEADSQTKVWLLSSVQSFGRTTQDVDIAMFGVFGPKAPPIELPGLEKPVRLGTFACTFELKSHLPEGIRFAGQRVLARYGASWKDASKQASDQMFNLRKYLEGRLGRAPFMVDFIWLSGLPTVHLPEPPHNILGCDAGWFDVMRCARDSRVGPGMREGHLSCGSGETIEQAALELTRGLEPTKLDRQRIERITARLLGGQRYAQELGTQVLVFRGRGGTGKTANLLRLAHDVYQDRGARILLLTYNNALVADLQRLLALMNVPSASASRSIKVQTIHSFLYSLHDTLVGAPPEGMASHDERFAYVKKNLVEYLGILTQDDRERLLADGSSDFNWDHILIDECQDWFEDERDILYSLYGMERIVLADGVDQFTRRATAADWLSVVPTKRRRIVPLRRTLRLKRNLCEFVLLLGGELGLGELNIEPVNEQAGGLITVYEGDYLSERRTHDDVVKLTGDDGNKPVDTLFVISDRHVHRTDAQERHSRAGEVFQRWGYKVWDGVDERTRKTFPTSVDQLRIVQYESCRGLEAWTTVCLGADHFYDRKLEEGRRIAASAADNRFTDPEQLAREHAGRWMLIPFTRSIDWLVIEISSRESTLGQILRRVTDSMGEPTEWL